MTDNTQPDALRLANVCSNLTRYSMDAHLIAAELRRQHARIAELESQLESIGAGGVSGPLVGQPQEMPDLSALTERGAKAWAGVDAQGLRDGVTSVAASAPAPSGHIKEPYTVAEIKAKIASNDYSAELLLQHAMLHLDRLAASAGSEPVATIKSWTNGSYWRNYNVVFHRDDLPVGTDLYTHPSPPEGMVGGWIALPGTLPEPGTPVLLDIGKKYPIRAMWAAKFTLPVSLEVDSGFGEHDERTDEWYCPEGWYEWNEFEETHWAVNETPGAWAPLPPTNPAGSGKGE